MKSGPGTHQSPACPPPCALRERSPNPLAQGLAVIPWARILSIMVHTTVMAMGPLFGRLAFTTITAKTMLAKPRGPNQPTKSLPSVFIPEPVSTRNTGNMRMRVRLSTA